MPLNSKPAQATITLKQMAAELAENHDLPKNRAEAVVADLMALARRHLQSGDKVRLTGLGILQVQDRPARTGRNPVHRGAHRNQGEQEDRLPGCQGTERGGVEAAARFDPRPLHRLKVPMNSFWDRSADHIDLLTIDFMVVARCDAQHAVMDD